MPSCHMLRICACTHIAMTSLSALFFATAPTKLVLCYVTHILRQSFHFALGSLGIHHSLSCSIDQNGFLWQVCDFPMRQIYSRGPWPWTTTANVPNGERIESGVTTCKDSTPSDVVSTSLLMQECHKYAWCNILNWWKIRMHEFHLNYRLYLYSRLL